jgi:hypothetical protein
MDGRMNGQWMRDGWPDEWSMDEGWMRDGWPDEWSMDEGWMAR